MIDLINTCVLIRTPEENEKLLKEAEKQGFHWYPQKDDCKPFPEQCFPDILKFFGDKYIIHRSYIASNCDFYEASELLGTKEMTAREFVKWFTDIALDYCTNKNGNCKNCKLSYSNTKCGKSLCDTCNWKGHTDELLEIVKLDNINISSEEKAIKDIEKLIQDPCCKIADEIKKSLKLAVEKLKEVK